MPAQGANSSDYNPKSFWFYPWGKSVSHKGVDIFAKKGSKINASTAGLALYAGNIRMGGNVLLILGPKWRLHYYAHLDTLRSSALSFVNQETVIGTVGATGNAAGKSPHLHYSIMTVIPYVWRIDSDKQGWRKLFYLNPMSYF
jgi:murein DD-endopeptidase MepM/ murein hydrolase activator NlpD